MIAGSLARQRFRHRNLGPWWVHLRRGSARTFRDIYTLDVILPVVNLHQRDAWIAHGPVQWLALVCTVAGWVLTTAVVLSLTGVLKRE
jgi:hypothetical protein